MSWHRTPGGKLDRLDPVDRAWIESNPRHKELAIGPDGNGGYRVDEARGAPRAEENGNLTPPVRRATKAADPSEAGADFIDGDGNTWDHTDARMGADDITDHANPPQSENTLVDDSALSPSEQSDLKSEIANGLDPGPDTGKVVMVDGGPVQLSGGGRS